MHIYQTNHDGMGLSYQIETDNGDTLILFKFFDGKQEVFIYSGSELLTSIALEKEEVIQLTNLLLQDVLV